MEARTAADCAGFKCARISATVCGCSLRTKRARSCGSTRWRAWECEPLPRGGKPFQVLLASLRTKRIGEHAFRVGDAAVSHLNRVRGDGAKLFQNRFRLFRGNGRQGRDGVAHHLHFVFAQVLQQLGGTLVAERDEKNRGLLQAGQERRRRRCDGSHVLSTLLFRASRADAGTDLGIFLRRASRRCLVRTSIFPAGQGGTAERQPNGRESRCPARCSFRLRASTWATGAAAAIAGALGQDLHRLSLNRTGRRNS